MPLRKSHFRDQMKIACGFMWFSFKCHCFGCRQRRYGDDGFFPVFIHISETASDSGDLQIKRG